MTLEQTILLAAAALHGGRSTEEGFGSETAIVVDIALAQKMWEQVPK